MKLNKTNIKKVLAESAFDPAVGPMQAIAQADNSTYYIQRAAELLAEIKNVRPVNPANIHFQIEKLTMATAILALAKVKLYGALQSEAEERPRSQSSGGRCKVAQAT